MRKKNILLYLDQSFEEGCIDFFAKFEPGPVYILSTETPDGPGLYVCDEPFTLEEADEQHSFVPDEVVVDDDLDDEVDEDPGDPGEDVPNHLGDEDGEDND